jgi:hypothetical protein
VKSDDLSWKPRLFHAVKSIAKLQVLVLSVHRMDSDELGLNMQNRI